MGIRILAHIVLFLLPFSGNSQPFEEQYKYSLPDSLAEYSLLNGLNSASDLSTLQHSDFIYYDAYLDTPDDLLIKNGFSLRIRKRVWNDSTTSYSMQLKSEMSDLSAIRVEVEEKELDFYRTRSAQGDTLLVSNLLDQLFYASPRRFSDSLIQEFEFSLEQLNAWLKSIAMQPITPYQYLSHLDSAKYSREKLSQLEVIMVGTSHRIRGHVFTTTNAEIPLIPQKKGETPFYFQNHESEVWLMETSLDYSRFYCVGAPEFFYDLREFEVESKYPNSEAVRPLIEQFSMELKKSFGLKEQQDSKYRQIRLLRQQKNDTE